MWITCPSDLNGRQSVLLRVFADRREDALQFAHAGEKRGYQGDDQTERRRPARIALGRTPALEIKSGDEIAADE